MPEGFPIVGGLDPITSLLADAVLVAGGLWFVLGLLWALVWPDVRPARINWRAVLGVGLAVLWVLACAFQIYVGWQGWLE